MAELGAAATSSPTVERPDRRRRGEVDVDEAVLQRVAFATERLRREQRLRGSASQRLSVRVDPGLLEAAQARTGLATPSEVVTAALTLLAADDGFGAWLVAQQGRLSETFELPL